MTASGLLGSGALAVALSFVGLTHVLGPTWGLPIAAGFNLLLNLPHQWWTWRRASRSPVADQLGWTGIFVAWLVVLGGAHLAPEPVLHLIFLDILTLWGLWHLVAQHAGISTLLRRTAGQPVKTTRRDRAWYLLLFGAGLLRFHALDLLAYPFGDERVSLSRLPMEASVGPFVAGGALALAVGATLFRLVPQMRQGGPRFQYETSSATALLACFFLVDDLLLAAVSATALHAVQYAGAHALADKSPLSSVFPWTAIGLSLVYAAAVTALFVVDLAVGRVVFVALVATHYTVDSVIWTRRHAARAYKLPNSAVSQ